MKKHALIKLLFVHLSSSRGGFFNLLGNSGFLLVERSDGKGGKCLHQASTVVRSGGIGKSKHGLGKLAVKLGVGVAESRLNVDKFLNVVKVSVHFNNLNVLAKVLVVVGSKLDTGGRAAKLVGSRSPLNLGSFVKQVARIEVLYTELLDALDLERLLVFLVEIGWENLNDQVSILLLGINVGIEVRLAGFNGGHDGFERVTTLFHITLDLPVELDIRRDVEVESKVEKVSDTGVVHRVQTFKDDDRSGNNFLRFIKGSVNVIVDWLLDGFSVLEGLDLLKHEVKVVLLRVKGSALSDLTPSTVIQVVIIEADNSGEVRDKGVGFPSTVAESSSEGANNVTSENVGKTTHESRLSASRISSYTNHNGSLTILQSIEARFRRKLSGFERGSKGTSGNDKGGGRKELHHRGKDSFGCESKRRGTRHPSGIVDV